MEGAVTDGGTRLGQADPASGGSREQPAGTPELPRGEDEAARHRAKAARIKAAKDRLYATKTREKGLLIVHTGTGKGKSTAAWGIAMRCLGHGLRIGVVYGGGKIGLMGEVADAALRAGGQVFGVMPEKLRDIEIGHDGLTELFVVDSMHARKMMMAQLSDAFIALPGGFGTLEEVFEATTWLQLGYHRKPVGLLNAGGYYDHLLAFLDHGAAAGFVRPNHRPLLLSAPDIVALLDGGRRAPALQPRPRPAAPVSRARGPASRERSDRVTCPFEHAPSNMPL